MPKIFGSSLLGVLLATIAFYMVGFTWYGVMFVDEWMVLNGISVAEAEARSANMGAMMYVWGILISLVQVIGLSAVLNWSRASLLMTCAKVCLTIAVLISTPVLAYGTLYAGFPVKLLIIDASHLIVGYVLVGVVLSFFRDD